MTRTIKTENLETEMRRLIAQGYKKTGYCYWSAVLEKDGEIIVLEREK